MLRLLAPAKINLTLEILNKRPDKFHEIRSVITTIDLADELEFKPGRRIKISADADGWAPKRSLVSKAVDLLFAKTQGMAGVDIKVVKHIPLTSGLGGDSSDGATTLVGLNRLWDLELSKEELQEQAAKLGSDVPFFVSGGAALLEGRGEKITPLPAPSEHWLVLIFPDIEKPVMKTAQLYGAVKPEHYSSGEASLKLVQKLKNRAGIIADDLYNDFEKVAFDFFLGLADLRDKLVKLGMTKVHIAGSGPTMFGLYPEKAAAEEMVRLCKEAKIDACLAETLAG